jgi:hypothetical protein
MTGIDEKESFHLSGILHRIEDFAEQTNGF